MHRLKTIANPFHRDGFFALPHLLIIAIAALIAYVLGVFTGWSAHTVYDAKYFESHYNVAAEHIRIPKAGKPLPRHPRGSFAPAGSIALTHYPGVGDQGPEGSCGAWAEAWAESYQYRMTHLATHPGIRFSPKCEYDHYRMTYNGGQDAGSWFDQDSELIPVVGTARYLQAPYPPWDASIVTSLPSACYNTTYRFPVSHTHIDMNPGGGPGLIDAIKQAIASDHVVLFALPVTASYDNATQTNGRVAFSSDTPNRGAHANVFLAWDDSITFPNGDVGGLLSQNQWTTSYGLHGRVWISYATVERFIFGVETVTVG